MKKNNDEIFKKNHKLWYGTPDGWQNSLFSVAVVGYKCPKCGAPTQYYCVNSSGQKTVPHAKRVKLVDKKDLKELREYFC